MAREVALRAQDWPREALTTWLWEAPGQVLASCETYRCDVVVDGQPALAWSIASVFTEPALRKRGHASAMLTALSERLVTEPGAKALLLFSDVDPGIYERVGFVARPAFDRVLPAEPGDADVEWLTQPVAPGFRPGAGFDLPVTGPMLRWQIAHGPVEPCGARVGDDVIVWQAKDDHLLVLILDAPTHGFALVRAAQGTAHRMGLTHVRGWETPRWPAGLGAREPRKGAVPMLKPLAAGVHPSDWVELPRGVWV
jgi:predicted N-acetyltransferase YhbS